MHRQLVALLPITIATVGSISGLSTPTDHVQGDVGQQTETRGNVSRELEESSSSRDSSDLRCSALPAIEIGLCTDMERKILASVVRLEVRALGNNGKWVTDISHGTIMGGRYLVTHNHFKARISMLETMATSSYSSASLFRADGAKIHPATGPIYFKVVAEDRQTLVLDFGTADAGQGFFESLGLKSASFRSRPNLQIEPGTEVAQVDWSNGQAFVQWVQIEAVRNEAGTAILALSNDLLPGASGGGVFWQGHHIANNWKSVEVFDDAENLAREYSKAAMNTRNIMSALSNLTVDIRISETQILRES